MILRLDQLKADLPGAGLERILFLTEHLPFAFEDRAAALILIGRTLEGRGALDAAIACYRRGAMIAPTDPNAWIALGDCLLAANRAPAAEIAYDAALRVSEGGAGALCAKGRFLSRQGKLKEAEAAFLRALELENPFPQASFGLASLAIGAGDWGMAETWSNALKVSSAGPELDSLEIRITMGRQDFQLAERTAAQRLARPGLSIPQRADLMLLLSDALEALGKASDAFEAAVSGKQLQHHYYAERSAGREAEAVKLRRLAAWFSSCDPSPWRAAAAPSPDQAEKTHVFLVGFPRSGTTLLEQALAGHPDVTALEEAPVLAAAYAEFLTSSEGLRRLSFLSAQEAAHWRAQYWREVDRYGGLTPARVFIDKNPANTCDLPLIHKLFPDAKVLFAKRDPRDVVLSCLRSNFQMNAMTYAFTTLAGAAECYDACMTMAEAYRTVLPLSIMDVVHEDLVRDFSGGLSKVCALIGIDLKPNMLDVQATALGRVVRTPSARQVREGLNNKGLGRWRAYADQLSPVMPILSPWVNKFGYG